MVPTTQELESLKTAVTENKISDVKKFAEKYGRSILNREFQEDGDQELYPDLFRYYLIHLTIQNRNLEMIKYLAENGVSPNVFRTKESNFNSRADQFMDRDSKDIFQWANYCMADNEILDFLTKWKKNYKGRY